MPRIDRLSHAFWPALVAGALALAGCRSAPSDNPKTADPPAPPAVAKKADPPVPASVAKKADPPVLASVAKKAGPLLLEDPPATKALPPPKGPVADNSRCHVCHVNFEDEEMTVVHARANIGCMKCHGQSDEHCGDEGNVTPPTTLYAKSDVDKSCKVCHPPLDEKIVEDARYCLFIPDEKDPKKVCTECHGKHQMARRTVRWDTVTRKLLP